MSATVTGIGLIVMSLRTINDLGRDVPGPRDPIPERSVSCRRLFIDGRLVARGGVGLYMVLSAPLTSGAGAGETITATSRAGIFSFSCRIVAVSPAHARV